MELFGGDGLSKIQATLATLGGFLLILMGFLQIVVTAFAVEGVPILEVSTGLTDGGLMLGLGILISIFAQGMSE